MARNNPVRIWAIKQRPRREPKFHQTEILEGAGRSTSASLAIFNRGWVLRRLAIGVLVVELQRWFFKSQVLVKILAGINDFFYVLVFMWVNFGVGCGCF